MLDYYAVLGVAKNASEAELRAAYLRLLKQFHPDIYQGADSVARTQEINEAYTCLKNSASRAEYDAQFAAFHAQAAAEEAPAEAQILAALQRDFAGKVHFWQNQIQERLNKLGKESSAALKTLFINHKKVTEADYNRIQADVTAQMQSYKTAKLQAAEAWYSAAASPEFEPETLLAIKKLAEKAAAELQLFYTQASGKAHNQLYDVFNGLNPGFAVEKIKKQQQEEAEAKRKKEELEIEKELRKQDVINSRIIGLVIVLIAIALSR